MKQVFYFGYDQKAWTRQQIMFEIAMRLLGKARYYGEFEPLPPPAQQTMLSKLLRARRHLLILDNLESITGAHLAIPNTLPPEEQTAVRDFLAALTGGKTWVLLGSRSGEAWLVDTTFKDNVYDHPGLDPEAASLLAERILERHKATPYRQDEAFLKLLKLLNGYPLPLEVVLANLARQTPAEVLTALQAGDVTLDKGNAQSKTESILRCIDYSHSNLSPDAQQLLLCLAPFTSVINRDWFPQYTDALRKQPALSHLPFERWEEVVEEAIHWGLLTPDQVPDYLRLQPVFPYFLKNRWQAPQHAALRPAVETAFRELYDDLAAGFYQLLASKEANEKQTGQLLVGLEYENLYTALHLALAAQVSILNLYLALSDYLDATHEEQRGLKLGETVLARLENYPAELLAGRIGGEFAGVIDNIAKRQLLLKQYKLAETSYQKTLAIWQANKAYKPDQIREMSASIYHQLGMVAQEQRQWVQAEQYYQKALAIKIDFNDRHGQAGTYHQLGRVAQEQRQWAQAEDYYQKALAIYIDFNDRHRQASTYHQLGIVAQEQRQWAQAEEYYQKALAIKIDFNDRYEQAGTYHQLGRVAQEQRQWAQAEDYYQKALAIFIEFNDQYWADNTVSRLAHLWQESGDNDLPSRVAGRLGIAPAKAEELLRQWLEASSQQEDTHSEAAP